MSIRAAAWYLYSMFVHTVFSVCWHWQRFPTSGGMMVIHDSALELLEKSRPSAPDTSSGTAAFLPFPFLASLHLVCADLGQKGCLLSSSFSSFSSLLNVRPSLAFGLRASRHRPPAARKRNRDKTLSAAGRGISFVGNDIARRE